MDAVVLNQKDALGRELIMIGGLRYVVDQEKGIAKLYDPEKDKLLLEKAAKLEAAKLLVNDFSTLTYDYKSTDPRYKTERKMLRKAVRLISGDRAIAAIEYVDESKKQHRAICQFYINKTHAEWRLCGQSGSINALTAEDCNKLIDVQADLGWIEA